MSGRSLPRPINYSLSRIVPPQGVAIDPRKRPVVVVDPRAGQGPGIGGFKAESEIGDALNAGHSVYFIGFGAEPAPGPAVPRHRRRTSEVLRTSGRAPSRRAASLCHRQLPGGLPDADGGDAAAGPVRTLPGRRLSDVILAGRTWERPDALFRRPARRELAHRNGQRSRQREDRRNFVGIELRQPGPGKLAMGQAVRDLHRRSTLERSASSNSRSGGATSSSWAATSCSTWWTTSSSATS